MNPGIVAMKGYSTHTKTPKLEPHHQIQLAPTTSGWGTVEDTDCISVEGRDPLKKKYSGYDIKQSDGEVQTREI